MLKALAWALLARPGVQAAATGQVWAWADDALNASKAATKPGASRDQKRRSGSIRKEKEKQ
ncbi:hypothetical protein GCM10011495_22610 [Hymenobacter frigidus]|jgi:hypothetical protein|uniref:Uncharacterized protein n=1 Tax=Hymenobacter frigidus TaxID=1524095 RepID=A0ABQ2A870_9BACT|nr:hypothetical protein GCM10011495_22610 [Hymenobacter frigidus]